MILAVLIIFRIVFKKFCLEISRLYLQTGNYACTTAPVHTAAYTLDQQKPGTSKASAAFAVLYCSFLEKSTFPLS